MAEIKRLQAEDGYWYTDGVNFFKELMFSTAFYSEGDFSLATDAEKAEQESRTGETSQADAVEDAEVVE